MRPEPATPGYAVGYFVGSLASESINRALSRALIQLAPERLRFVEIPIGQLPLYSRDFDDDYPPEAQRLKEAIHAVDALVFVTLSTTRSTGLAGQALGVELALPDGSPPPRSERRRGSSGRRSPSRASGACSASATRRR